MILTEENFIQYCSHHYLQKCDDVSDMKRELAAVKIIQKSIERYLQTSDIDHRLILNKVIILFNNFGRGTLPILFFRIKDHKTREILFTFLVYMFKMPREVDDLDVPINFHNFRLNLDVYTNLKSLE